MLHTMKIAWMASLLLVTMWVQAQNSLSGRVTDSAGQPLIGANIFLPELKTGTSTDIDGRYELTHLPARKLLVQVSYVGYTTVTKTVEVQGDVTVDFALEEAHVESREIVVTGLSISQEKRRSPVSIEILKKNFLFEYNGSNLVDRLERIAGVSAISTGPAISKPVIRGLGYNRVLVVQDGVRQEGQQWGDEHGLEIDDHAVERIEIYRGPASLMYGSDGLGGVIHLESPHPAMNGTISGSLLTTYHTNNRQVELSPFLSANYKGWNGYFSGSAKKADDYRNAFDGKVFNSGFEQWATSAMLGLNRTWGYSHLHLSSFYLRPDLTEGDRNPDGSFVTDEAPFQKILHNKLAWNNSLIFKKSSLRFILGLQRNQRQEFEEPDVAALDFDLKTLTYDLKYFTAPSDPWEFTYGFSGMVQNSKNRGEEYLVPDYAVRDQGAFAYMRRHAAHWEWSAGIRYDHRRFTTTELVEDGELRFAAITRDFSNLSASVGMGWFPSETTALKLNVARGFRSPNVAELSSNGVHEGTFRYEHGNADLDAETNLEIDASFELDLKHLSLSANPFLNFIDNYIFLEKLASYQGGDSLTFAEGEWFPTFRYTQGKARLSGGEFSLDIHPHPYDWIHFKHSFSFVLARQLDSENEYLPFIPPPKYQMELRADFPSKKSLLANVFAEISLRHHFRQNRILAANDFETPTPAYTLFDANVGFEWKTRQSRTLAHFAFSAENIFDKPYQSHLSRLKYAPENPATGRRGVYDMGRNFTLKVRVPFSAKIGEK